MVTKALLHVDRHSITQAEPPQRYTDEWKEAHNRDDKSFQDLETMAVVQRDSRTEKNNMQFKQVST